jgi:prolipoprotein diacylglyceryltransferase
MLLLVFFLLRALYRRPHPGGSVMIAYLFLYGCGRFVVEAFRGDSARHLLDMTVSQQVALGMIGTALVLAGLLRITAWRKFFKAGAEEQAGNPAENAG